jgi:hypothetical protein
MFPLVPIVAWRGAAGVVAGSSMIWRRKNRFTVTSRAAAVPPGGAAPAPLSCHRWEQGPSCH